MTSILQHTDWLNGRVPDSVRSRLRQLVEVVGYLPHHQPLAVLTADAVLLAANRPFLDLLGASDDEQLGADWDDFMPGWSQRTCVPEPHICEFEDYLLPVGGEPVWVRAVACPVLTAGLAGESDEALAAWALFVLDRRPGRADADERRGRAILEFLLEIPSEFVVQLSADGAVEYLSPSLRRAMGVFGDGIEGGLLTAVHALREDAFHGRFTEFMEQLRAPPYSAEFEMKMTTAGAEYIVEWRFESLLADGGAVRGILGVGHDVTERRRAEEKLARSELQLRTLVEATQQLIWTTEPGGGLRGDLDRWCAFTGQTPEEAEGDGWLEAVHDEDRERVRTQWAAAVEAGVAYDDEYRLGHVGGGWRWIEAHAVPLTDDDHRPRYFGVGQDVTGRKAAERDARRRARLETTVAAVSRRLAGATLSTLGSAVDATLGDMGRMLGADRTTCSVLSPDRMSLESVRVWDGATALVPDGDVRRDVAGLDWVRQVAGAGHPFVVRSLDDLPDEAGADRETLAEMGVQALLAFPLVQERTLVGLLTVEVLRREGDAEGSRPEDPVADWAEEEISLARVVADQLAGLFVWSWDEANVSRIGDCFLSFGPEVEDNLTEICRTAGFVLAADAVLFSRRDGDDLITAAGWNVPDGAPSVTPLEGSVDAVLFEAPGEQVQIVRRLRDKAHGRSSAMVGDLEVDMYAGFPVLVDGQVKATLSCLFTHEAQLRESQLELMRVLGRAAAVEEERRRALEDRVAGLAELEQAMERTVTTLSAAVGTRDPYTTGHESRVAALCAAIGVEMGMGAGELRFLRLAAAVHDIGKITLPAEILTKPTRLSEVEFELIKQHCEAGWEMLEPAGLPESVTDAVLQHHERLDGSGYPAGLLGDEIGTFARVIAVADVVEAMSSHRPYRPALGLEPALAEIEAGRGVRYDERAVDACLHLFREKGFAFAGEGRPTL